MSGLAVGQKINTESSMDRKPLGALPVWGSVCCGFPVHRIRSG
jgi:hypothetical protein